MKFFNFKIFALFFLAGTVPFLAPTAQAITFGDQLLSFSAKHEGMGGGGAAFPQDFTATMINPAGLSRLPTIVSYNLFASSPVTQINTAASPVGNAAAGTQTSNEDGIFMPSGGVVYQTPWFDKKLTVGFSLIAGAGFGTDYDQPRINPALLSGGGTYDTHAFLGMFKVINSVAYQVNKRLSIGASLHLNRAQFETDSTLGPAAGFAQTRGGSRVDLAYGAGFGIGVLYEISEMFSVGLDYNSEQYMEKFERYTDLLPDGLNQPQQVNFGIAFYPNEVLTFTADFRWINWSGAGGGFGTPLNQGGFGWQDQYIGIIGAQWQALDWLQLRTGFNHTRPSVPEEGVFTSLLAPTINRNHFTLGAGIKITHNWTVDISYARTFDNTITDTSPFTAGSFARQYADQGSLEISFTF